VSDFGDNRNDMTMVIVVATIIIGFLAAIAFG